MPRISVWPAPAWAYAGQPGRDLRIDLLRGLAVLAMVVDHLGGPSPLYLLTGGNRFYTSAAEGFIALSGLTVGLVYRRCLEQQGLAVAIRRLLARAWTLYVLAVGLTLVMLPVSEVLHLHWASGLDVSSPVQVVWAILSLHQTYYLVDVLALYVLLMLVAPLALFMLGEGRTWLVLGVSWLVWAGFQVFPAQSDVPWPIAGNNLFHFSAWQALFFTAMVAGYHRRRLAAVLTAPRQTALLLGSVLAFIALIWASTAQREVLDLLAASLSSGTHAAWSPADLEDVLLAKADVGLVRILASLVVFGLLYLLTTRCWVPIRRTVGWLLLPLGQHALYAYATHVVLALVLGSALAQADVAGTPWTNAAIQLGCVGIIWLAIRLRVLYPRPEHRRPWMASVVPLAGAALLVLPSAAPAGVFTPVTPAGSAALSDTAVRQARAFGTPIPANAVTSLGLVARAAPAAPPSELVDAPLAADASCGGSLPVLAEHGQGSAADYVGAVDGTFRELVFHSPALDRDMSYYVYLPPDYTAGLDRYPVLYMLHGAGGTKDEWPAYGLVNDVDQLIAEHAMAPLIVVMPQGDVGYWVNWANGGPRWGDYVTRDLRCHVDATYRTLPDAAHRAIGGLSMGGAGAVQLAFNHPDVFQVVGGHSPSPHLDDGTFAAIYGTGVDFAEREPIDLAAHAPGIETLKVWLDAGEDDPWLTRDELLHEHLVERGIDHAWQVLPGGHDGDYWIQNLPTYLHFYDRMLNPSPPIVPDVAVPAITDDGDDGAALGPADPPSGSCQPADDDSDDADGDALVVGGPPTSG